jgi:ketosteroid isomerase-like protein
MLRGYLPGSTRQRDTGRPMSRENVELHHRVVDLFNRGEVDALLALTDDDVVVFSRLVVMEGGYRGHDGVRRWRQDLFGVFPDWNVEVTEVRDLGDLTLATLQVRGHGGESGAPINQMIWQLAEWRDGRFVRMSNHANEAEALEAVGLRE